MLFMKCALILGQGVFFLYNVTPDLIATRLEHVRFAFTSVCVAKLDIFEAQPPI